jgi:hypothetical protein
MFFDHRSPLVRMPPLIRSITNRTPSVGGHDKWLFFNFTNHLLRREEEACDIAKKGGLQKKTVTPLGLIIDCVALCTSTNKKEIQLEKRREEKGERD